MGMQSRSCTTAFRQVNKTSGQLYLWSHWSIFVFINLRTNKIIQTYGKGIHFSRSGDLEEVTSDLINCYAALMKPDCFITTAMSASSVC